MFDILGLSLMILLVDDCGDNDFDLLLLSTTSTSIGLGLCGGSWLFLTSSVVDVARGRKLSLATGTGLDEVLSIGIRLPASRSETSVCVPVCEVLACVIAVL